MTRDELLAMYLDWYNNFLTIDNYAEFYGLSVKEAKALLLVAKSCAYNQHPEA